MKNKHGNTIDVYKKIKEKKLTAANSHFFDGVAFYIVKQDKNGKAMPVYCCYLYPSGYSVGVDIDKVKLIQRLNDGIGGIKKFMEEHEIEGI